MYMKKSVVPVGALTVGYSLIQLGSVGAVSPPPPPASTGQVSGGGPGGEAPEAPKILYFTMPKWSKTARLFVFFSFCAELSHLA